MKTEYEISELEDDCGYFEYKNDCLVIRFDLNKMIRDKRTTPNTGDVKEILKIQGKRAIVQKASYDYILKLFSAIEDKLETPVYIAYHAVHPEYSDGNTRISPEIDGEPLTFGELVNLGIRDGNLE